jgi:hypothetical protein
MVEQLIERLGGGYAKALGIELSGGREGEVFKWFLASFLYGARIPESIATKTYQEFRKWDVVTPGGIQDAGWHKLVDILDAGGYVRYDFSTATKLLLVSGDLITHYDGRLTNVHAAADSPRDLESRLRGIGKGVGPVTANIFLRELRGIWPKAEPLPSEPVVLAARHLGLLDIRVEKHERMLECLKEEWRRAKLAATPFTDFEAALLRLGLRYCRKEKHAACPMGTWCPDARAEGKSG